MQQPQAATANTSETDAFAPGRATPMEYLRQILTARVYDIARETELDPAQGLSRRLGNRVHLKREDNQPVFSFKVRGAYNKMRNTPQAALERGVITASAGNHAHGVAISAARLGVQVVHDLVSAIGLPKEKLCTYCWTGKDVSEKGGCPCGGKCPHATAAQGK